MFCIDISKWSGRIDFAELKKNEPKVDQVIMRVSEGDKNPDPMFPVYFKECQTHGFPFAVYHFCTWNDSDEVKDATSEAKFLVRQLQSAMVNPGIRIWIDTESNKTNIILSRQEMGVYLDTFMDVLRQNGYKNYGIYGGKGFISAHFPINHQYGHLPLWVASYNGKSKPTMPPGWDTWELWQWTKEGQVKGVKTRCDLSRGA